MTPLKPFPKRIRDSIEYAAGYRFRYIPLVVAKEKHSAWKADVLKAFEKWCAENNYKIDDGPGNYIDYNPFAELKALFDEET